MTYGRGASAQPSSSAPEGTSSEARDAGMHGEGAMCPMKVEGARVTVEDIDGGVAMVFTTPSGNVQDLRARVRRMVEMHSRMRGGGMHGGSAAGGGMCCEMMGMIPSNATVIDVERGARVELRPRDPGQLEELRSRARTHAQQMSGGRCPMKEQ